MAAALAQQLQGALEAVMALDAANVAQLLRFLNHQGDKFFANEVVQIVRGFDQQRAVAFVNGFVLQDPTILALVPAEVQASVVTSIRLHHLQQLFRALSAPQILALHRAIDGVVRALQCHHEQRALLIPQQDSRDQIFQVLSGMQKVLSAQPLANLRNVHQMYQDAGPDADMAALGQMLAGVGSDLFYVVAPVRQVLALDIEELKTLRESLAGFTAAHLSLLAALLALDDFKALEMRSLFAPLMLDEPEAFMGGGFALGMSGEQHAMDVREHSDEDDDDHHRGNGDGRGGGAGQPALRLEVVEQPPVRCVYRRNLKPAPMVQLRGIAGPTGRRLAVALSLVRCDTMAELDETALEGDTLEPAAMGTPISFARVKVQHTSHQMDDTHFSLRFQLREYVAGNSTEFQVLHTTQSVPFTVLSHSTQVKKPQQLVPSVAELIPASGNVRGGTQVVVLGSNFYDSPGIRVRFDQTDVMPTYHGPGTLVCITPPHAREGAVAVRVCNDGRKWGEPASGAYQYVMRADPGKAHLDHHQQQHQQQHNQQQQRAGGTITAPPPSQLPPVGAPISLAGSTGGMFGDMPMFFDLRNSTDMLKWSSDGTDLHFMLSHSTDLFGSK